MHYKSGFAGHDSMREKAIREFGAEMRGFNNLSGKNCYKSGGKVHGRVKKDIGGEIQKAGLLGLPGYFGSKLAGGGLKHGGKAHKKPVRRNMGGMMGMPESTADKIQDANQILSNAASTGTGLKRGGRPHHHRKADGGHMMDEADKLSRHPLTDVIAQPAGAYRHGGKAHKKHIGMRSKRAYGGTMDAMGTRDFNEGRKAMGFNHGGRADLDGYSSKKAMGFHNGGEMPNDYRTKAKGSGNGGEMISDYCTDNAKKHGGKVHKRSMGGCYEMGGEIKKAIGGVGKIRHGQMTRRGAQIAPRARFKG